MTGSAAKDRAIHLQRQLVNPVVKLAWAVGIPPPGDAMLETTGRRTGQPRRTPVCDGLDGQTFWPIAQRGRCADWIQNIEADPRGPGQGGELATHPLAGRNGACPGW